MLLNIYKEFPLLNRIVFYLFGLALLTTFTLSGINIFSVYRQEVGKVKTHLDDLEQTQINVLTNNVWTLNKNAIEIQLKGILQYPEVVCVQVSDNAAKTSMAVGECTNLSEDILSKDFALRFIDGNRQTELGHLAVYASTAMIKERLVKELPAIVITEFVKISIICFFVLLLFIFLFHRHIQQIIAYTRRLGLEQLNQHLDLKRGSKQPDEIDQIVNAVNEMQDRLLEGIIQKNKVEESLRRSEERLQLAFEGANLGLWDWNVRTGETYFSPRYFTMLGYAPDELPHNFQTWDDLLHPEDKERIMEKLQRCLEEKRGWNLEFRLRGKSGKYRWIMGNGKVVEVDEDGEVIRASGTHLDITRRKVMEEEIQKVKKLESVGLLAGGIAHDFNNILLAILGNLSLASHLTGPDEKVYSLLQDAEKATVRAKDLTQQLLTFAKGGEPVKKAASIQEVIRDSASFVLHGGRVSCEYNLPDDLWFAEIDKGQISQVIQNIVVNANQAMPEGGTIFISAENVKKIADEEIYLIRKDHYLKIEIRDTGIGIPEHIIGKIFDPYFTTKQTGSGLGLATTHSIISKHDGHIAVRSAQGEGTTFTIFLPALRGSQDAGPQQEKTAWAGGLRVLVMDDDAMVRDVAENYLKHLDCQALLAVHGEEAIEIYKKHLQTDTPIDLVILDLTVPGGLGGKDTAAALRAIDPKARLIVASGYSNDPVMANYRKYGFCAAVSKPFHLHELQNILSQALHKNLCPNA